MKNRIKVSLLLFFTVILFSDNYYSQSFPIDKGSKIIGGSFSFSSAGGDLYSDSENNNFVTITLNGSAGFFVSKSYNLGFKVLYNRSSQGEESVTQIGFAPTIYYFFGDENSEVYPFIGTSFFYTDNNYISSYTDSYGHKKTEEYKVTGTAFSLGGGFYYMVSNYVGLFTEAGYQWNDNSTTESGTKIYLNVGISAFIY